MITVIDYGMGNLRSVEKAVEHYTPDVRISEDPASIASSKGIILPGDGAFAMAMQHLRDRGWVGPLTDYIRGGGFFMGICLGFQLLFSRSEEFGDTEGLGIIPGDVVKFNTPGLKVPHMGWNSVSFRRAHPFLDGVESGSYFYFIHTFYPEVRDDSWILGEAEYGVTFPCVVGKGNVIATQFHPEKSHRVGLKIVENFVRSVCL